MPEIYSDWPFGLTQTEETPEIKPPTEIRVYNVITIDAARREIKEFRVDSRKVRGFTYTFLDGYPSGVQVLVKHEKTNDTLFTAEQDTRFKYGQFFFMMGAHVFCGNGVIVGTSNATGNYRSAKLRLAEVSQRMKFLTREEALMAMDTGK